MYVKDDFYEFYKRKSIKKKKFHKYKNKIVRCKRFMTNLLLIKIQITMMKLTTLLILSVICILAMSDSCGGNCPSGKCPTCFCSTNKSMQDIAYWCDQYSWDKKCCQCIVSHESGGNAHAINYNTNGSTDVGLWQINNINWGQCSEGKAPCDPKVNLNCAIEIYKWGGNTFKLWSTHAACGC